MVRASLGSPVPVTPKKKAEIRREFFDMVEALERTGGPAALIATSIATLACAEARLRNSTKPMVGILKLGKGGGLTEDGMGAVVQEAIEAMWVQCCTWERETTDLSAELCREHLDRLGVNVDVILARGGRGH